MKSETRNPKSEPSPKSEIRISQVRASGFGFVSDLGFRISDFGGSWASRGRMRQVLQLCLIGLLLASAGCRRDMFNQPYSKPLGDSDFFRDNGMASRPLVPHTVARGHLDADEAFYTGMVGGKLVETFPFPITREVLERGRERFDIYCSPCHGRTGDGNGLIVQRGFPPPPSYHIDRLRQAPVGHFYDVITRGYGVMYPYAARVEPADRWAIVAYIRALQLSHDARLTDLPESERAQLEGAR